MQRTLVQLNLYCCEAVQNKLKNSLKIQKMHFLPVFELTLDSLTTTQIEQHQCPSFDLKKKYIYIWFFCSNENNLGFHMRYHFFLPYEWFLQNLGKDFIRTNMHTYVVCTYVCSTGGPLLVWFLLVQFLLVRISNQYGFLKLKKRAIFLISTVFFLESFKKLEFFNVKVSNS